MKIWLAFVFAASFFISAGNESRAQSPTPTYWQDIRPIFRKHCIVCHQAKNIKEIDVSGGLALDTFEAVKKGSARPVLAAKSAGSLLIQLLETGDAKKRMPLDSKPIPKETIDLVRRWIDTGAKEGTRTDDAPDIKTAAKSRTARKLDVLLSTAAVVPPALVGTKTGGKLDLALRIGPLAPVAAVAFSPDNKLLASGGFGQVAIWDLDAARPVKVLTNILGAVHDLKFSPDGKILAVAGGQPAGKGDLRLYQVASRCREPSGTGHQQPQGPARLAGSTTSDWKLLAVLRGHDDVVFSVAFTPDGKKIASASFDHTVRLWDAVAFAPLATYTGHSDFVYVVAFSPDGQHFVSGSKDRSVRLVETATLKTLFTLSDRDQDVLALSFSPDGKFVVASGYEPGITWWNPKTGERTKSGGGHGVAVHELAFSKDGKRLVSAGGDRLVRVWDGSAGTLLKTFNVGSIAYAAAISPNNKLIASGSFDGLVRLWDEAAVRQLATLLAFPGEADHPEWLALTPEGYAAGSDKLIAQGRWKLAGAEVKTAPVWAALRQPDQVARAFRGEVVPVPKFDAKK